jgi:hypothetical protein
MPKKQGAKWKPTLLVSGLFLGMLFTASLRHNQEDGHCWQNLKSNCLVLPHKQMEVEFRRRGCNCCFWSGERDLSFAPTVNPILVGMIFLRNGNIQPFTVKPIVSVNSEALILRFHFTFHLLQHYEYNAYRHISVSYRYSVLVKCFVRVF